MKSSNFPTIDAFFKGVATSVKTMNLNASSYLSGNKVFNALKGYIDDLAKFNGRTWAGETVPGGNAITKRVLEVGIPKGATKAQLEQIQKAIQYAKDAGVKVNVRVIR